MFWAPWHQSMSTYSQQSFSSSTWKRGGVWMCKLGMISQEQLKIEVKLLLSANRKSYMSRRLAQQRMTLNGRVICIIRWLCGSWACWFCAADLVDKYSTSYYWCTFRSWLVRTSSTWHCWASQVRLRSGTRSTCWQMLHRKWIFRRRQHSTWLG